MSSIPLYAYFGHHKCASSWIVHNILTICGRIGMNAHECPPYYEPTVYNNFMDNIRQNKWEFLILQESSSAMIKELKNFKGFHVIRDPRDMIVSAYFSHLYSHPIENWDALAKHRQELSNTSQEKGLMIEMDFMEYILRHMEEWDFNQSHILELKMEDLVAKPSEHFIKILDFLGILYHSMPSAIKKALLDFIALINRAHRRYPRLIPLHWQREALYAYEVEKIMEQNSFQQMAKRQKKKQKNIIAIAVVNDLSDPTVIAGPDTTIGHYRKGQAGDWKNYFNEKHIHYFKEKYNPLLIKLGYEKSPDWELKYSLNIEY